MQKTHILYVAGLTAEPAALCNIIKAAAKVAKYR